MRMGERYGAERLEAACGRALAINNPRYKSVEAILKSGLDKVPLTEATEAKSIPHDNIRGGAYFDRGDFELLDNGDEIEARYLDEERFAIMNEPRAESERQGIGPEGPRQVTNEAAPAATHRAAEPLPMLLERLQALWVRPRSAPVTEPSRRRVTARPRSGFVKLIS
jgi:hypothetical protein